MTLLIRSAALAGYAEMAHSVGVDPYAHLAAADLPAAALNDPEALIRGDSFARLLEATAAASGCDDFGLRLSETRELSHFGALGLLIRDQANFGDVLRVLDRYLSVHTEGITMPIEADGELVIIRVDVAAGRAMAIRQVVELSVGAVFRMFKLLLGNWWRPVSICFRHAPPNNLVLHRRFFACPIDFGQDFDAVVIRATDLAAPISRSDPTMSRHVQKYLDTLISWPNATATDKVRQLITVLLPTGTCTVERVARHLGVDYRTVQRRLAREGQSFSTFIDQIRGDLATRHILSGDRSMTEIASLLGFSALSAFSRWFRHHFKCSAKEWRRAAASTAAKSSPQLSSSI